MIRGYSRRRTSAQALLIALTGLGGSACLDAREGAERDGDSAIEIDTGADTEPADTEPADTGPADTGDTNEVTPTCAVGCDDGDPCTDDECVGASCVHDAIVPCEPQCTSAGLVPLTEVPYGGYVGVTLATRGAVQMSQHAGCTDDGICNCFARPALVGYQAEVELFASPQDETEMSCRSRDSAVAGAPTVTCDPFAVGAEYRVWGVGAGAGGFGAPGEAVPVQVVSALDVDGYCLETEGLAPSGRYRLLFERGGATHEAEAEIAIDEPGWMFLHVRGQLCPSCALIDQWVVLEVLDNGVRFAMQAALEEGGGRIIARLASIGNRLAGEWVSELAASGPKFTLHGPAAGDDEPHDSAGAIAAPERGAFALVRLPAEAPRSPCASPGAN